MKKRINLSAPLIDDEEWNEVRKPLQSGWVTSGPYVSKFEQRFAKMHEVEYASAVSNCTNALHLALLALDVGFGDEVIVPTFSWASTANAVRYCGAEVVFVDVDPNSYNLNPKLLEDKISSRTKAIIVVHLFGLCAEMDEIVRIADNIPIIEDAACAAGSKYKGVFAGGIGDIGCFSFHPRKSVTTGEGGMVTTNKASLAEIVNRLRNHGSFIEPSKLSDGLQPHLIADMPELGFNYRLSDIQAAIGYVQLKKIDGIIEYKNELAQKYIELLGPNSYVETPITPLHATHSWQAFVVKISVDARINRNELMKVLKDNGIETRPGTQALHMLSYYSNRYNIMPDDYPVACMLYKQSMALPLHTMIDVQDVSRICQIVESQM